MLPDLQVSPDIKIAAGDLVCAKEDMPAVTTSAINPERVFPAVGGRAIEGHLAALVAVGRIDGPCCLVPSALEIVRHLGGREREDRDSGGEKGSFAEHGCE